MEDGEVNESLLPEKGTWFPGSEITLKLVLWILEQFIHNGRGTGTFVGCNK